MTRGLKNVGLGDRNILTSQASQRNLSLARMEKDCTVVVARVS